MLDKKLIESLEKMRKGNYKRLENKTGIYPIIIPAPTVDKMIKKAIQVLKESENSQ